MLKKALIPAVLIAILLGTLSYLLNISLPYMQCGGATIRGIKNKCVPGFSCKYSLPECDGCGGICKPNF